MSLFYWHWRNCWICRSGWVQSLHCLSSGKISSLFGHLRKAGLYRRIPNWKKSKFQKIKANNTCEHIFLKQIQKVFLTDATHSWALVGPSFICQRLCQSPIQYVVMTSRISWQTLLTHNSVTVLLYFAKFLSHRDDQKSNPRLGTLHACRGVL